MDAQQPRNSKRRHAAIVLETIVALPIMLIALLAVVEFGMLSAGQACLQMASRAGADMATQVDFDPAGIPPEIVSAVTAVLDGKGITLKGIRLESRIAGGPVVVQTTGAGAAAPITAAPTSRDYVRISVCVENNQLAPNLLRNYCIDITNRVSQKSTTRSL